MKRDYKLAKENKKNPKLSDFEVIGVTIKPKELMENVKYLKHHIKQAEAQVSLENTQMNNYMKHYPDIQQLLPVDGDEDKQKEDKEKFLVALKLYLDSRTKLVEYASAIDGMKKALKEDEDALKKIEKLSGQKYE